MSRTVAGNVKKMLPADQVGSPSVDEDSSGGSMVGGGSGLKKGPWTSAEDAILVDYVKKHGEGNWNAVQKHSGLFRCGKSCRLRWANHLRPNLKKGTFTPEEEQLIVELHSKMGNKWARMAAHLPGRTDNEIKNYWNTRIKRRQRAGLPIYPPEISFSMSSENQQGHSVGDFASIDKIQNDVLRRNGYDIPDINFDDIKITAYALPFPEISFSNMMSQGYGSQNYGFVSQPIDCKRSGENETLFPAFPAIMSSGLSDFENFSNDPHEKINLALGATYAYDLDPLGKNLASYEGANPGSHALINGNCPISSSLPGIVKQELPSLQYTDTDPGCFAYASSPQSESVDTYLQSPPTVSLQSGCSSPRNSGLLEVVLQESKAMHDAMKQSSDKSTSSSIRTPSDFVDSSANNLCDETAWEDGDQISPLSCSAASVFNACTSPISGSPMAVDELQPWSGPPGKHVNCKGTDNLLPNAVDVETSNTAESNTKLKPEFLRPDALLGSDWLLESSQVAKDRINMNNAIAALLDDDRCCERKSMPAETTTFAGGLGLDSYPWNNMPRVCQMSGLP